MAAVIRGWGGKAKPCCTFCTDVNTLTIYKVCNTTMIIGPYTRLLKSELCQTASSLFFYSPYLLDSLLVIQKTPYMRYCTIRVWNGDCVVNTICWAILLWMLLGNKPSSPRAAWKALLWRQWNGSHWSQGKLVSWFTLCECVASLSSLQQW